MTLQEAFKKMIISYFDEDYDDEVTESSKQGPRKYTKKYFTEFETNTFGDKMKGKDKANEKTTK